MKFQKLVPVFVGALCFALNAQAETTTPSKTEGKAKLNIYYVSGETGTTYTLSSTPNERCGLGVDIPCEVHSDNPLPASVPKAQLDTPPPTIQIMERQESF